MSRAGTNRIAALPTRSNAPTEIGALEIPLFLIDPDPDQPRQSFDELRLDELAASIRAQGIIEPLVVSPHPDRPGRYLLVAGERRWRAARMAGLARVPVVLRDLPDEQRLAVQLVENIDREALTVLEEAAAVARLIAAGHRPKAVAEMLGKPPAWVSLRRKIAAHRGGLHYVVAQGMTRDAETLAVLAELEQIDPEAFGELVSGERIRRADARASLDLARRRQLALTAAQNDDGNAATGAGSELQRAAVGEGRCERPPTDDDGVPVAETPSKQAAVVAEAITAEATRSPLALDHRNAAGSVAYDAIQRALTATLGLPVVIDPPGAGKPGELRIRFDEEWMLANLQRRLVPSASAHSADTGQGNVPTSG